MANNTGKRSHASMSNQSTAATENKPQSFHPIDVLNNENIDISNHNNILKSPHVIVIGAGASGLMCAIELMKSGVTVSILEGRTRIGGRIHTIDLNTYKQDHSLISHSTTEYEQKTTTTCVPVDLGAAFLHGCDIDDNEAYKLCTEWGITDQLQERVDGGTYTAWYTGTEPNKLLNWRERDQGYKLYSNIDDKMLLHAQQLHTESLLNNDMNQQNPRVDTSMQAGFDAAVKVVEKDMKRSLTASEHQFLHCQTHSQHAYNAEMCELSLHDLYDIHDNGVIEGPQCLVTPGYGTIVHTLASKLHKHIQLNTIVQSIQYNDYGVIVTDTNGTQYTGDYVVCTTSIGCLKRNTIEFDPSLPASYQTAIDGIGMGVENKIILQYNLSDRFWPTDKHWTRSISHPLYKFVNLDGFGVTGCLLTLIPPPLSKQIETQSDTVVLNNVLTALKEIFGHDTVKEPKNYIVTRWGTDPFSYGSYHYLPVHSGLFHTRILTEPINNRLYLAGEATSTLDGQTVHGALGTGIRAAQQIMTHAATQYKLVPNTSVVPTKAVYPLSHYHGVLPCQRKRKHRLQQHTNELWTDESDDETDCYCNNIIPRALPIIQCDQCGCWYHLQCVNETPESVERINVWLCWTCIDDNNKPYMHLPIIKAPKRPITDVFAAKHGFVPCTYTTHSTMTSIDDYVDVLWNGRQHACGTVYKFYQSTNPDINQLCDYAAVRWQKFAAYDSLLPLPFINTQLKNDDLRQLHKSKTPTNRIKKVSA